MSRHFHGSAIAASLAVVLSACTITPVVESLPESESWLMKGKLGVVAEGQSGSFTIEWSQQEDQFAISLFGALGMTAARIIGDSEGVSLQAPGEPLVTARSADALLLDNLGLDIPVTPLRFWVRGVPAPGPHRTGPDSIHQLGWTIEYLQHQEGLPVRMRLTRPEVRLVLVVRQWTD